MPKGVKKSDSDKIKEVTRKIQKMCLKEDKLALGPVKVMKAYLREAIKDAENLRHSREVKCIQSDLMGSDYLETKDDSQAFKSLKTSCPLLLKYKRKVKAKEFKDPVRELRIISTLLDNSLELYNRHDWDYLYKRWKKVQGRVHDPTARYQELGAVPGRVPVEKRFEIILREQIKKLKDLVIKELNNVKQDKIGRS